MNAPYFLIKGIVKDTCKRSTILKKSYPHYMLSVLVGGKIHTAAINTYSRILPHALRYYVFHNHSSTISSKVSNLEDGIYQNLGQGVDSLAIDYIRSGLFDINYMNLLPPDPKEDIHDLEVILDEWAQQAIQNNKIKVCLWGREFKDSSGISGIHDIHMNQGYDDIRFSSENAVWQDGCVLFIEQGKESALGALFLAFQSQCLETDSHGNCITVPVSAEVQSESAKEESIQLDRK